MMSNETWSKMYWTIKVWSIGLSKLDQTCTGVAAGLPGCHGTVFGESRKQVISPQSSTDLYSAFLVTKVYTKCCEQCGKQCGGWSIIKYIDKV